MATTQSKESLFNFYRNPYARGLFVTADGYFASTAYNANYEIPQPPPYKIRFERLNELPETVQPSTMYIIKNPNRADLVDLYFSNIHGSGTQRVYSSEDIQNYVDYQVGGISNIEVVANIAARDALVPSRTVVALVTDATGDNTVRSGAATYLYNPTNYQWVKIAEFESVDVTFQWSALENKPISTAEAIDQTVIAKHAHSNSALLAGVGEDELGGMLYKGISKGTVLSASEW